MQSRKRSWKLGRAPLSSKTALAFLCQNRHYCFVENWSKNMLPWQGALVTISGSEITNCAYQMGELKSHSKHFNMTALCWMQHWSLKVSCKFTKMFCSIGFKASSTEAITVKLGHKLSKSQFSKKKCQAFNGDNFLYLLQGDSDTNKHSHTGL